MQNFARFVANLFGAFITLRHFISLVTTLFVLIYGILTLQQQVPLYSEMIPSWMPDAVFFVLVYIGVAFIVCITWVLFTLWYRDRIYQHDWWRTLNRQGDRAGLFWFDCLLLGWYSGGAILGRFFLNAYQLVYAGYFLAVVLSLPIILGWGTARRPMRYVVYPSLRGVPGNQTLTTPSIQEIVEELYPATTRNTNQRTAAEMAPLLRDYNQLTQAITDPLPEGMIVDIPVRV